MPRGTAYWLSKRSMSASSVPTYRIVSVISIVFIISFFLRDLLLWNKDTTFFAMQISCCDVLNIFKERVARGLLLYYFEILVGHSSQGADPIVGNVFKQCSWGYTTIRVSYCRVVNPITYCAIIFLFHSVYFLSFINLLFRFLDAKVVQE